MFLLMGLIGSGKSTWAQKHVSQNPRVLIVNRDSIRSMLFGKYKYELEVEVAVREAAMLICRQIFRLSYHVLIDETNLRFDRRRMWAGLAEEFGAKIHLVHLTESRRNLENRMKDPRGLDKITWGSAINKQKEDRQIPIEKERARYATYTEIGRNQV